MHWVFTMKDERWYEVVWAKRRAWRFTAMARTNERYARSSLGNLWIGLSTLLTSLLLGIVYGTLFRVHDSFGFFVYIAIGLTAWNSLAGSIGSAPNMFRNNQVLLRNTNIHPVYFAVEEWFFNIIAMVQSLAFVALAVIAIKPGLAINLAIWSWIPLINLAIAMYWIPVLVAIVSVKYEDFFQMVPLGLQLSFLLAPVLYEKSALGNTSWIADFNFLYLLIESLRSSILKGVFDWKVVIVIFVVNCLGTQVTMSVLDTYRYEIRSYA